MCFLFLPSVRASTPFLTRLLPGEIPVEQIGGRVKTDKRLFRLGGRVS